jgi:hypothetical protein
VATKRPLGLKPALILNRLRGAEAPLFHRCVCIHELFSSLLDAVNFRCQIPMQNVDLLPIGPYPPYPRYIRIKTLGRNCSQSIQNATLKGKVLAALDLGLLAPFRGRAFAYFAFQNFQRTALVWNGFLAGSGDGHTLTLARTKRYGEEIPYSKNGNS